MMNRLIGILSSTFSLTGKIASTETLTAKIVNIIENKQERSTNNARSNKKNLS